MICKHCAYARQLPNVAKRRNYDIGNIGTLNWLPGRPEHTPSHTTAIILNLNSFCRQGDFKNPLKRPSPPTEPQTHLSFTGASHLLAPSKLFYDRYLFLSGYLVELGVWRTMSARLDLDDGNLPRNEVCKPLSYCMFSNRNAVP